MPENKTPNTPATSAPEETPEQLIARLKEELAAKDQIIAGQAETLQAAEAGAAEGRTVVTHEGNHYRVLVKQFDVDGTIIMATELKGKQELIKKLVEGKSGLLQLIVKEEAKAE